MGVPDETEGPPRKRSRLSLRTQRGKDDSGAVSDSREAGSSEQDSSISSSFMESTVSSVLPQPNPVNDTSSPADSVVPDATCEAKELLVPPVASLYNLGNTCFMNCMLQVLRYTPGLVSAVKQLQEEIACEESKTLTTSSDPDEISEATDVEPRAVWQFVKTAHQLFLDMEDTECRYIELATGDGVSMAVRPATLLDNIRSLNPMFEGNFQHDAQELLRCLLCYMEDAEKELRQIRWREREQEEELHHGKEESENKMVDIEAPELSSKGSLNRKTRITSDLVGEGERSEGDGCALRGGDCHNMTRGKGRVRGGRGKAAHKKGGNSLEASSAFMETFLRGKPGVAKGKDGSSLGSGSRGLEVGAKPGKIDSREGTESAVGLHGDGESATDGDVKTESTQTIVDTEYNKGNLSNKKSEKPAVSRDEDSSHEATTRKRKRSASPSSSSQKSGATKGGDSCQVCGKLRTEPGKKSRSRRRSKANSKKDICSCVEDRSSINTDDSGKVPENSSTKSTENQKTFCVARAGEGKSFVENDSGVNRGGNGQKEEKSVGILERIQRKFRLSSQSEGTATISSGAKDSAGTGAAPMQQRSILSMLRLGQVKRLGIRGRATVQMRDPASQNTENVSPLPQPLPVVKEETESADSGFVGEQFSSSSPSATICSPRAGLSNATHSSECPSKTTGEDHNTHCRYNYSRASLSPRKSPQLSPQKTGAHKSSLCLTPRSPISVEHCDEISPAPVGTVPSAPPLEKTGISPPGSPFRRNLRDDFFACSPTVKKEAPTTHSYTTLESSPLPGSDITVHSPSKLGGTLPATRSELGRVKISSNVSSLLGPLTVSTNFPSSSGDGAWLTPPVSKTSRKYSSAPNSPNQSEKSPAGFNREGWLQTNELHRSPNAVKIRQSSLKLEVRKCDWLGVSPVKSISARHALAAINSITPKTLATSPKRSSAVRKISYDQQSSPVCEGQKEKPSDSLKESESSSSHLDKPGSSKVQIKTEEKSNLSGQQSSDSIFSPSTSSSSSKTRGKKNRKSTNASSTIKSPVQISALSVSLQRCDWLLAEAEGKTVSVKALLESDQRKSLRVLPASGLESKDKLCCQILPKIDLKSSSSVTVVEQLFAGFMVHQTRCLECEGVSDRQEAFMDISVPVRGANPDNEDSDCEDGSAAVLDGENVQPAEDCPPESCLSRLVQAFASIERLQDTNKYWCEGCDHYTEAERSCHYTTLPAVLTLHLKRFSASAGLFGGVSKLNDRVSIPQRLPCLHHNCEKNCSRPAHQYSLYAVVTHSGLSILHGHYRAYVRVQQTVSPQVHRALVRAKVKDTFVEEVSTIQGQAGADICADVKSCKSLGASQSLSEDVPRKTSCDASPSGPQYNATQLSPCASTGRASDPRRQSMKLENKGEDSEVEGDDASSFAGTSFWLECDDECVRVLEEEEFESRLNETDGALMGTPYVLFYHKLLSV